MPCIGCAFGAACFAVIWGGGKVVELTSSWRRNVAMKRALAEYEVVTADQGAAETAPLSELAPATR